MHNQQIRHTMSLTTLMINWIYCHKNPANVFSFSLKCLIVLNWSVSCGKAKWHSVTWWNDVRWKAGALAQCKAQLYLHMDLIQKRDSLGGVTQHRYTGQVTAYTRGDLTVQLGVESNSWMFYLVFLDHSWLSHWGCRCVKGYHLPHVSTAVSFHENVPCKSY